MRSLIHHTTSASQPQFSSLEALLDEPFPRTPEDLLQLEQRLSTAAVQVADQMMLVQLTRAHEDEGFVRQAIAQGRARSPVPLVHKGGRTTSVLLLGGTCLVLEMPYLREDRHIRRGRRRHKRGSHGAGCYPVLEALGIADRVSPATRSEIALHVVQAASYLGDAEAVWALLIGYLRLLGAAYADVVECIADGAEWIWKRVERLSSLAEIPAAKLVEVLDFYYASPYLSETIATGRSMSKAQYRALEFIPIYGILEFIPIEPLVAKA